MDEEGEIALNHNLFYAKLCSLHSSFVLLSLWTRDNCMTKITAPCKKEGKKEHKSESHKQKDIERLERTNERL